MSDCSYRGIIETKKAGRALDRGQVFAFAGNVFKGAWPDYQIAALTMALRLQGMNSKETLWLTQAMAHYSEKIKGQGKEFSFAVDKHSTGGVGDGISLVLAPLAASLGLCVPMMSGRSLGITGGTLDKLDSIPGMRTQLKAGEVSGQLKAIGLAMFGQTDKMAPVDRKLYALRDVIGAIDLTGLIVASIVSKKLTEGLQGLVFDVKFGRGAIFDQYDKARELALGLIRTANACGLKSKAVVTRMEEPLGRAVGNALEIIQAWEIMRPGSPLQRSGWKQTADFMQVTQELLHQMLCFAGKTTGRKQSQALAGQALKSGAALNKFRQMLVAQGVPGRLVSDLPKHLPRPKRTVAVRAGQGGFVSFVDAKLIALAGLHLKVVRRCREDEVDFAAGVVLGKKIGDFVRPGEAIADVHAGRSGSQDIGAAARLVRQAFLIRPSKPRMFPVIKEVMG
ncbi:MAG: thymidine phosphorylase [Elusimicrobia bacterium]|nr:thymidine phosphorylase [Elusimicrobiota bacterium]